MVVSGSLSRKPKIYLMPIFFDLAQSIEFRKAQPVISIGQLKPRDCQIGWDTVMHNHIFSNRLVSEEAL